jgi:predicted amidohydrolase YtcJ
MTNHPYSLPKLALKPWLEQAPEGYNLINCQIIDPVNSCLLPGLQAIAIRKGKIVTVCPVDEARAINGSQWNKVDTVDLKGAFVCP